MDEGIVDGKLRFKFYDDQSEIQVDSIEDILEEIYVRNLTDIPETSAEATLDTLRMASFIKRLDPIKKVLNDLQLKLDTSGDFPAVQDNEGNFKALIKPTDDGRVIIEFKTGDKVTVDRVDEISAAIKRRETKQAP